MIEDENKSPGDAATPPQDDQLAKRNEVMSAYIQELDAAEAAEQAGNSPDGERPPTSADEQPFGGDDLTSNEKIAAPLSAAAERALAEALDRMPQGFGQVLEDATEVIDPGGGRPPITRIDLFELAMGYGRLIGLRFLAAPDRNENDDDVRKGDGRFVIKQDGQWVEPNLSKSLVDLQRIAGSGRLKAIGVGSQSKALKARLADEFLAGTIAVADGVIPSDRRTGDDAIEPMVMDAAGKVISLAKQRCGETATPHDDHPLLRRLAVEHDPAATCPEWDRKIHWAMQSKAGTRSPTDVRERVQFLEEMLAMGLHNGKLGNRFQRWLFIQGTGGNFKGGCLDAVMEGIYGKFGRRLKSSSFFQSKYSGDEKVGELQQLEGCWLAVVGEAPKYKEWRSESIKDATGGPKLTIRPMGQPERDIVNSWFLICQGNTMPNSPDASRGWDRRQLFLLFDNEVGESDQDAGLADRLLAEAPGIFNRLLAALERIHARGIYEPPSVRAQRASYKTAEKRPVIRFFEDYLRPKADAVMPVKDAYKSFKAVVEREQADDDEDDLLDGKKKPVQVMKYETFRSELHQRVGLEGVRQNPRSRVWELLGYELLPIDGDAPPPPPNVGAVAAAEAVESPPPKSEVRDQQRKTFNEAEDADIPW